MRASELLEQLVRIIEDHGDPLVVFTVLDSEVNQYEYMVPCKTEFTRIGATGGVLTAVFKLKEKS